MEVYIDIINAGGKVMDRVSFPDPSHPHFTENEGWGFEPESLSKFYQHQAKADIDRLLESKGIDAREQIVTTANGLQFALSGIAVLVNACANSSDDKLKASVQPLIPFATMFLQARETGDLPIDILGNNEVANKVINTSLVSGKVVKEVIGAK